MQTQAHTQAALQAQMEAQAQVPVPQAQDHGGPSIMERFKRLLPPSFKGESDPLLAESWMREIEKIFQAVRRELMCGGLPYCVPGDGAIDIAWFKFVRLFRAKFIPEHIQDRMEQEKAKKFVMGLKPSLRTRLVAFDHRTLDEDLSAACRQEGEMEQYLEEKKALQKRRAAPFQWQDKKKAVYQTPQRPVVASSIQVPSQHSPGVKKECPHCGKTHGGTECWKVAGKCLKCGSSDHKIKDCPRLQQEVQHGAPTPAVVAAVAPAIG
ncbi:hypothetical protein Taro_015813 [Colocasia esculenta]|uniref:CCHC-type domain-containing protein n=1 Tax=Colocasia esculenta TaxID=4460 RepID=A0A843UNB9_COLES|nr:hypothetical protein [Colocasia esculenta]